MAKQEQEVEVQEPNFEIIDDTPEEDRGKEPLPKDNNPEPSADELEDYSDKVKNRIGKLKKAYHDERRVKEAKEREAREAFKFAQSIQEENKKLKENLQKGEDVLVEQSKAKADAQLAAASEEYRKAYEVGDSDKVVAAQTKMTQATVERDKWDSYAPKYGEYDPSKRSYREEKPLQTGPDQVYSNNEVPKPDAKAEAWFKKNTWFGSDEEMTALAYGLHEKLVKGGVDPRSDEYYERIDSRIKEVFPTRFEGEVESGDETVTLQQSKPANVVAPVKRSPSSKKIRLTQTQVALAKRLNVPLEEYAKKVAELEK
jgi:myosin heavy subunit